MFEIAICGAGRIGKAVALLLTEVECFDTRITFWDSCDLAAKSAVNWLLTGSEKASGVAFDVLDLSQINKMAEKFKNVDTILDCLPGTEASNLAKLAIESGSNYINLTEYVKETDEIISMSKSSGKTFVLQTGLAPGFINMAALKLYNDFIDKNPKGLVNGICLKVGALSQSVLPPSYYCFTWSPIGVATEYLEDAVVIRGKKVTSIPSLSSTESVCVDGHWYEDDYTSGGIADLALFFENKVENMDYKTLRYPGHFDWARGVLKNNRTPDSLEKTFLKTIPIVNNDVVVVYASIDGYSQNGSLIREDMHYRVYPKRFGGIKLSAIQATTAAGMAESLRLICSGKVNGLTLQSQMPYNDFLNGPFIKSVYGK